MGQKGWAAALAGSLLLVAGCGEQSRVAPDQPVAVTGRVVAADGTAVSDLPVRLGVGVTSADGALAALTLGLHCASGVCTGAIRDTASDAEGAYRFDLEGGDTQSSFGRAESVLVTATGPPRRGDVSGPLSSARFHVQTTDVRLPDLELVDPDLALDGSGGVHAQWDPAAPGPYELRFETGDAELVWRAITSEPRASVDPRVLEGTAGRAVVSGRSEAAIEGGTVALAWRSGGVPYASAIGSPPSRGRPCGAVAASGASADARGRCGVTDGHLSGGSPLPQICGDADERCEPATAVVVDLGAPLPAELVVVRGCAGGCAVDVSADGSTFRPVGAVADAFGALALDGAPIAAIRVGLGDTVAGLDEVSVWGPSPSSALRPVDDGTRAEIAAPYRPEVESDGPPLLLVVAAAAAIMLTVAGGVSLASRSNRSGQPASSAGS